jgi:hypothetical protein
MMHGLEMRGLKWLGAWLLVLSGPAWAAAPGPLTLRGHDDGRLDGSFVAPAAGATTEGLGVVCRLGTDGPSLSTKTGPGGAWSVAIPDDWRARSDELVHVTVGEGDSAATAVLSLRTMPLPFLPPTTVWSSAAEVDEPESAFCSLGRTPWHFSRNPALIVKFHDFLREQKIDPPSLLAPALVTPPDTRRILIEPELLENSGWKRNEGWIVAPAGHRGPTASMPLRIDRGGFYRCWVRFLGHRDGVAVTRCGLFLAGREAEQPHVVEEFHTRVAEGDGPQWHDFIVNLSPGDYTIALEPVVNYHHTPKNVPLKERRVDCVYLTDELWREPPDDAARAALVAKATADGPQRTENPPLAGADRDTWRLWQVRPSHWETAVADPRLFTLSHRFWRREIDAIADRDYAAPPHDPVAGGAPDYRDPRRQVIFDPAWNMVGNPFFIRRQRRILEGDIDPLSKDATFEWIAPGNFPVVSGQWQRANGGLSADHAATSGLAAGTYQVPGPGTWHLWVQFKNINYFEYFGVYADTIFGRAATWERSERLYPGGRAAWAKVGTIDVPALGDEEIAAHRALAAKGVFVERGRPVFAVTAGEWKSGDGWIEATGTNCRLAAKCTLKPDGDFHVRARLSLTGIADSGAAFSFFESNRVLENRIVFTGTATGAAFGAAGIAVDAAGIAGGEPFDFECIRGEGTILLNGRKAAVFTFADPPGGIFELQPRKATMRVHDFSASGALDEGLDALRQVRIGLWMDKYINARTYRGVYGLLITDDGDFKPEGSIMPKPSPGRFLGQMKSCGFAPGRGYVLNVNRSIGRINQTWMPDAEPKEPVIDLVMARDTVRSASLQFRSGDCDPIAVTITPAPLASGSNRYPDAVRWRAVAFAPYGNGREDWSPLLLLRRPFLAIPPLGPAAAWLTVDSTGLPPGTYTSSVVVRGFGRDGRTFPDRTVTVRVRVADVRVAPRTPILVHGWVTPPPGEEYKRDWFQRFNVWQGPALTKDEMRARGIVLQIFPQWNVNADQVKATIAAAKAKGLDYDDWMFSIKDEPTGLTPQALAGHIAIAKMIREADPKVRITMNPGEAARAATFSILQPYVDLWNPYSLHLSYGPSGRDYLKKPWIWYTTPCYGDKSPGLAAEIYGQVRSVLRQPADCRGTAFFAPYYPWRDPWDTAYEHIKDVSVFVLPSRHGPVATPTWEALREAVQDANLARMVREQAGPDDAKAKALWESGGPEELIQWLETDR